MTEMTNNGLPVGSEDIPGTTYWGCESKFHKICIEADQRPNQRPWSAVMDYVGANPEEAAMFALVRQGSLKLTPLVSTTTVSQCKLYVYPQVCWSAQTPNYHQLNIYVIPGHCMPRSSPGYCTCDSRHCSRCRSHPRQIWLSPNSSHCSSEST